MKSSNTRLQKKKVRGKYEDVSEGGQIELLIVSKLTRKMAKN